MRAYTRYTTILFMLSQRSIPYCVHINQGDMSSQGGKIHVLYKGCWGIGSKPLTPMASVGNGVASVIGAFIPSLLEERLSVNGDFRGERNGRARVIGSMGDFTVVVILNIQNRKIGSPTVLAGMGTVTDYTRLQIFHDKHVIEMRR